MQPEPLTLIATCDLVAMVRGRAVPARGLDAQLAAGVGWVPADLSLHPFGGIVDPNPFGSLGDLRLIPDPTARCRVDLGGATPLDVVLADLHEPDGTPWSACPRGFLRRALADLEAATGLRVRAAFEQEFLLPTDDEPAPPFSLEALRRAEPFGSLAHAALTAAGLEPEMIVPEYAADQFEIPCAPALGMAAADRAVHVREVLRELARMLGLHASFAPIAHPDQGGSGVHIHVSLVDADGRSAMAAGDGLSEVAGAFAAGILRHARALVALTAPTPASFVRLQPHRWSAGVAALADANREALLRIPTPTTIGGRDAAAQLRLEYRAADATANPHLALGAIVRAVLAGIADGLAAPAVFVGDADALPADALAAYASTALPTTLAEALNALVGDPVAAGWMPPLLLEAYLGVKRWEVARAEA
ncbi:MAG: glutamine synthetase, partial [Actinomycetota bacterium]